MNQNPPLPTHFSEEFSDSISDQALRAVPSPVECDLLVLTDRELPCSARLRTIYFSFDSESSRCLRLAGATVKEPSDYSVPDFVSYDELFEHYFGKSSSERFRQEPDDGTDLETACRVVTRALRQKAPEVCAPILFTWQVADTVIAHVRPTAILVDVDDWWLKTVLDAFMKIRLFSNGSPRA